MTRILDYAYGVILDGASLNSIFSRVTIAEGKAMVGLQERIDFFRTANFPHGLDPEHVELLKGRLQEVVDSTEGMGRYLADAGSVIGFRPMTPPTWKAVRQARQEGVRSLAAQQLKLIVDRVAAVVALRVDRSNPVPYHATGYIHEVFLRALRTDRDLGLYLENLFIAYAGDLPYIESESPRGQKLRWKAAAHGHTALDVMEVVVLQANPAWMIHLRSILSRPQPDGSRWPLSASWDGLVESVS